MAVVARVVRDLQPEAAPLSAALLRVALQVKRGRPVSAAIRAAAHVVGDDPRELEARLHPDLGLLAMLAPRR